MPEIVGYRKEHFEGVDALWKDAFPNDNPWNVASVAIPEKTRFQPDLILVALDGDLVVGSVMAGYDGHRGWISRIAVLKSHQKKGVGEALIFAVEERLAALGCIKVNLQVLESNSAVVAFYERSGYQVERRISMSKLLRRS
ncbi:MAG TPA: GNAT family acetyltransferase [Bradyrhizobium sp.]|nr:GNAT family acetyltransferase [Bradyrhizobium sp.]